MAVLAMASPNSLQRTEGSPYDSDSRLVGVDNRCSGCITHQRSDIPGTLKECNRVIKGFGGTRQFSIWTGTIHWTWDDDEGKPHTHVIPNSFYIPQGKVRLLSPQHWAQTSGEKPPHVGETTTAHNTVLFWNEGESRRTIPISNSIQDSDAATFQLSSRYKEYHNYHALVGYRESPMREPNPFTIHNTCDYSIYNG